MTKSAKTKPATKSKKVDAIKNTGATTNTKTAAPVILPSYMKADNKKADPYPVYVPSSDELLSAHQNSLDASLLKSRPNTADTILAAQYGASGEVQWLDVSASIAGENGALQMKDTFVFDPTAAPEDVAFTRRDPLLPPIPGRTDPYPIQFYFKREVSYADKKGRILSMEYVVTMGFTIETWRKEAGIFLDTSATNQWHRLRYMQADEASATLLIDGQGLTGDSYIAHGFADGFSMVFDQLALSLNTGLMDLQELDITMLARPDTGVGYQFGKLHSWLDHVDHERWKKAHPDKPWYEDVGDFTVGLTKSVYNNTIGAVYQAGLQLSDMQRLWWAVALKKTGIADYNPSMWSDVGKAAEQGATTTDLLVGMAKGTVLAPYRFVKAVQNGDAEAAGEALGDTAFAIEGARGTIKSAPKILHAGKQGLGKLRTAIPSLKAGLKDFHAGLRGKGDVRLAEGSSYGADISDAKTMSGISSSSNTPTSGGGLGGGTRSPELQLLDDAHYGWVDQMRTAIRGEGPEPAPWQGAKPELDAQGTWSGTDPAQAYAAYQEGVRQGGYQFEVIIARNRLTGLYKVMIGHRDKVMPPKSNAMPSEWDTVVHYHPNLENAPRYTRPAPKDEHDSMIRSIQAPHPKNRPHIEFVESTINGKTTRAALVHNLFDRTQQLEVDASSPVLGLENPRAMSTSGDYKTFWKSQEYRPIDTGEQCVLPGTVEHLELMIDTAKFYDHRIKKTSSGADTDFTYSDKFRSEAGAKPIKERVIIDSDRWVPSNSQAARKLMLDAAFKLKHEDLAKKIEADSPEHSANAAIKTQSGQILDSVAPPQKLSQRELIKIAPPGSPYHSLKEFGLPPRFANPIGEDEVADLGSMRIVQSADELRELMKKSRLAGGFYSNGQSLDPTRDLGGSAYWLVIQGKKGELWLVPHYLLEKKTP